MSAPSHLCMGMHQVLSLPTGRSRSTIRRSCMRRATDSDIHPVTSSSQHPVSSPSQHPVTGRVPTAAGQQPPSSTSKPQADHDSCDATQPLVAAKVQRSLTWTEEGQAGVGWGTEGGSGGESSRVTRETQGGFGANSKEVTQSSEGSHSPSTGMADTTIQQQQQQRQQQQQDRLLGVSVQVSTTAQEAISSQSSPSMQPSRHGAVPHRQALTASTAAESRESECGSSNSGQMLVPARFRTGTLSARVCTVQCLASMHCLCLVGGIACNSALLAFCGDFPLGHGHCRKFCSQQLQWTSLIHFKASHIPPQLGCLSICIVSRTFTVCLKAGESPDGASACNGAPACNTHKTNTKGRSIFLAQNVAG